MASAKQIAAARRNIKKAQAALRKKSRPAKKSHKPRAKARSRGHKAVHARQSRAMFPEAGKWARAYRVLDVLTGGVQRGIRIHGATRMAAVQAKNDILGIGVDGKFNLSQALPHAEGVGVGLIRDKIRSKLGVYRGMAKGKLASYGIALSPEIIAVGVADPLTETWAWKSQATMNDRGYSLDDGSFQFMNEGMKESVLMDGLLFGVQKLAEKTGVNRELSKLTDGLVKI